MSRRHSTKDYDAASSDGDVTLSNDELSEGDTTDSGESETGYQPARPRVPQGLPPRAASLCTLCDAVRSEYVCAACGRLAFCLKCAVSLHDNKFLGSHTVVSCDDESVTFSVQTLRDILHKPERDKKQQRAVPAPMPSSEIDVAPDQRYPTGVDDASSVTPAEQAQPLDLVALHADRNVLMQRVRELRNCNEMLSRLGNRAAEEKAICQDATRSATEAVKKKFDVIRTLLAAKEKEFTMLVEDAGRKRMEAATKHSSDITTTIAEHDAYISHLHITLDRLEGNKKLFNESRRSLLDESQKRLSLLDDQLMKYEGSLDDVHAMSLGVPVAIDGVVDSIQRLHVPVKLSEHYVSTTHVTGIPADRFQSTPGVAQFSHDGEFLGDGISSAPPAAAPSTPRRSFAKEVDLLKHSSPPRIAESSQGQKTSTTQRVSKPSTQADRNAAIARTAARLHAGGSSVTNRLFPPELEALKESVAQRNARRMSNPQPQPVSRASSPRGTPTRRGSSPGPRRDAPTPGPGAYYNPQAFNARSYLSTPPRSSSASRR